EGGGLPVAQCLAVEQRSPPRRGALLRRGRRGRRGRPGRAGDDPRQRQSHHQCQNPNHRVAPYGVRGIIPRGIRQTLMGPPLEIRISLSYISGTADIDRPFSKGCVAMRYFKLWLALAVVFVGSFAVLGYYGWQI